jgi:hypothetical protein
MMDVAFDRKKDIAALNRTLRRLDIIQFNELANLMFLMSLNTYWVRNG